MVVENIDSSQSVTRHPSDHLYAFVFLHPKKDKNENQPVRKRESESLSSSPASLIFITSLPFIILGSHRSISHFLDLGNEHNTPPRRTSQNLQRRGTFVTSPPSPLFLPVTCTLAHTHARLPAASPVSMAAGDSAALLFAMQQKKKNSKLPSLIFSLPFPRKQLPGRLPSTDVLPKMPYCALLQKAKLLFFLQLGLTLRLSFSFPPSFCRRGATGRGRRRRKWEEATPPLTTSTFTPSCCESDSRLPLNITLSHSFS